MSPELAKTLKEEVEPNQEKSYRVIMVYRRHLPKEQRYETKMNVQSYDKIGFEKIAKNYSLLGASKVILLHDPSKPGDSDLADNFNEDNLSDAKELKLEDYTKDQLIELGKNVGADFVVNDKKEDILNAIKDKLNADVSKDDSGDTLKESDIKGIPDAK